jgi:hypothetical protein
MPTDYKEVPQGEAILMKTFQGAEMKAKEHFVSFCSDFMHQLCH